MKEVEAQRKDYSEETGAKMAAAKAMFPDPIPVQEYKWLMEALPPLLSAITKSGAWKAAISKLQQRYGPASYNTSSCINNFFKFYHIN